jgi:hypothetical protein
MGQLNGMRKRTPEETEIVADRQVSIGKRKMKFREKWELKKNY